MCVFVVDLLVGAASGSDGRNDRRIDGLDPGRRDGADPGRADRLNVDGTRADRNDLAVHTFAHTLRRSPERHRGQTQSEQSCNCFHAFSFLVVQRFN